MIPRSYSRGLALQLNFIYDATRRSRKRFEGTTDANYDGRFANLVLFGFADSWPILKCHLILEHFSYSYVVFFTLAALSAILLGLP